MEICIFYSWQSKYRKNCDNIITKALEKAIKELNDENPDISYTLERGGGDVQGAEHIDNNIDEIIKNRADLAIADFTHIGNLPQIDENTGEVIHIDFGYIFGKDPKVKEAIMRITNDMIDVRDICLELRT